MRSWWSDESVRRLLSDLIPAHLSRLRPGLAGLRLGLDSSLGATSGQSEATSNHDWVLDLDSLAFLDLATTVAVQFHLHRTELDDALLTSRRVGHWVETILRSRARWDEAISFQTSGSTGRPKLCTHPMALLEEEIAFFADRLRDRRRLLSAVPCHHIYGFIFSIMLPAVLGIPVRDVRDTLPGRVLRCTEPGDVLIGHPTFFDLATRGPVSVAVDTIAISSAGHCPTALWQRLDASGFATIHEVYGATETAGIGIRQGPDVPFRLLPYWSHVAGSDVTLSRPGPSGDPVEVDLPDEVQWLDGERFHVLARRDNAVQVGGINVFPERVSRLIRKHPEVADALVRLTSAEPGGRLKAFVVPGPGCQDPAGLPERLRDWLAERLQAVERPTTITVGSRLPQSTLGKPADWD